MAFKGPFQAKPFCDSMLVSLTPLDVRQFSSVSSVIMGRDGMLFVPSNFTLLYLNPSRLFQKERVSNAMPEDTNALQFFISER